MKVSAPRKRAGAGGTGRYSSTKSAKGRGVKSLPPARRGRGKTMAANPMAHGGNC